VQLAQVAQRIEKAGHDTLRMKSALWCDELTSATEAALTALERHLEERQRQISG
jgi:hypothetical protein